MTGPVQQEGKRNDRHHGLRNLFYPNRTVYNQLLILNDKFEVDLTLLAEQGLPYYAGTWVIQLLVTKMFTHLLLWNRDDLREAWSWATPANLRKLYANFNWRFWNDDGDRSGMFSVDELALLDPHYRQMLKYPDTPNLWYFVTLVLSPCSWLYTRVIRRCRGVFSIYLFRTLICP